MAKCCLSLYKATKLVTFEITFLLILIASSSAHSGFMVVIMQVLTNLVLSAPVRILWSVIEYAELLTLVCFAWVVGLSALTVLLTFCPLLRELVSSWLSLSWVNSCSYKRKGMRLHLVCLTYHLIL